MSNLIKLASLICILTYCPAAWSKPCDADVHDDFDFLIGEWLVHSPDGTLQGENSVQREEGQCLLIERWRGAQGSTGQSYNYVNPQSRQWHQLWVSQGAIIDYSGGLNRQGAMHLAGQIIYQKDGREARFTGTWTPLSDGTVRQELKQFNAKTNAWANWFVGIYSRKVEALP